MNRYLTTLAILGGLAACAQAAQPLFLPATAPLEAFACQSDRIVLGNVIDEGQSQELDVGLPGRKRLLHGMFQEDAFNVSSQFQRDGKFLPPPYGVNSGVPPAPLKIVFASGNRAGPVSPDVALLQAAVAIQKDAMFILFLRQTDRTGPWLVIKSVLFQQRGDDTAVRTAADFDHWAWGPAVDGLEMALILIPPLSKPASGNVNVTALVALRNVSDKPLAVDVCALDKYLALHAQDPQGNKAEDGFYRRLAREERPAYSPEFAPVVQPGRVLLIGPDFVAPAGFTTPMDLSLGTWVFTTEYQCQREALGELGVALWNGKIRSAAVKAEVLPTPAR